MALTYLQTWNVMTSGFTKHMCLRVEHCQKIAALGDEQVSKPETCRR